MAQDVPAAPPSGQRSKSERDPKPGNLKKRKVFIQEPEQIDSLSPNVPRLKPNWNEGKQFGNSAADKQTTWPKTWTANRTVVECKHSPDFSLEVQVLLVKEPGDDEVDVEQ